MPHTPVERDIGAPDRHGRGAIFPTLLFFAAALALGSGCLLADPRPSPGTDADSVPATDGTVMMASDSATLPDLGASNDAGTVSDAGPASLFDCPNDGMDGGLIDAGADASCPDFSDAGADGSTDAATDSGL